MSDYVKRSERNKPKKRRKKKRKSKKFKILMSILIFIILIFGIGAIVTYAFFSKTNRVSMKDDKDSLSISDEAERLAKENKIKNILFIGSDEGTADDHGRSDSMILVTVDKKNKKIKTTSFMRDALITIPGVGEKNLNNAYAYGGSELLVKTFNYNFGLDISDYVKVDFKTFIKIIDKLGGVELNVNQEEIKVTNDYIDNVNKFANRSSAKIKKSGLQNLDGVQALAYSRNRYVGNDFTRTNRQRIVLEAIFKKISKEGYTELIKDTNAILPDVTTTLNIAEITDIGSWTLLNKVSGLESACFPKREEVKNVVTDEYHMVVDKEKLKKEVQDYIYYDKK